MYGLHAHRFQAIWITIGLTCVNLVESSDTKSQCGYSSCPEIKSDMLNVHLVPHTHNDVGWVETVDQYYESKVRSIINTVVNELLADPKKRFIYVESAFFHMWWLEQTPERQKDIKMLVNEGRLEFTGGAWTMNDEATTHYQSIIDQFSWGLKFLNDTFGDCGRPRIGWQIDSFGHSREMASMFVEMGYDGLFFGRLDYQDKNERLISKKAEMIWRTSSDLDKTSDLFTGALYNQYQSPSGFCFDILCDDDLIIDTKESSMYNVDKRVNEFFRFINKQRLYYRTQNIIVTMGGDFTYSYANQYFANLDNLIRYSNNRQDNGSDINVFYSTPSCYLKSLHDADITWPTKDDDFFPYASDSHVYWTGFFTSRPTLKRFERIGNHFLQVCKQLSALAPQKSPEILSRLSLLRETMGIMQHHDAVTGTEKQHVASDYSRRLDEAIEACSLNTHSILNLLITDEEPKPIDNEVNSQKTNYNFEFKSCNLLNISTCDVSEGKDHFLVTLYNPLSYITQDYIRIPVPGLNYIIKDNSNVTIDHQMVPISDAILILPFRHSIAKYEIVFLASELPALGYKSYYISKTKENPVQDSVPEIGRSTSIEIGNENIRLTFDSNGFLSTFQDANGTKHNIRQEFFYYKGAIRNVRDIRSHSSGAYIFRPLKDKKFKITTTRVNIKVYRGNLVEEVHQKFNNWISQVVRVYRNENHAEFEWIVGPIPVGDRIGKEIITQFNSDIESKGLFYTDSNGRNMIKRQRGHRDTWKVKILEHSAGNYYPITTKIALEDDNYRMSILTDRAQGGSSMNDGSLELMIHRRLLDDDGFGVDEPLNEKAYGKGVIARGTHYLLFGSSQIDQSPTLKAKERFIQLEKLLPPWRFFSDANNYSYIHWAQLYGNNFSGLSSPLPKNINLMTFEPWHENEILIRFEHILEKNEDPDYSKSVKFNLQSIFNDLEIIHLRETTLDGNVWLNEQHERLKFDPDPDSAANNNPKPSAIRVEHKNNESEFIIEMAPMQIRTFILTVTPQYPYKI